MIDGLILGLISWLSLIFTWFHLPKRMKLETLKHPLISDIIASGLAFMFLSGISKSLVAVVGAIFTGLLVNLTLVVAARSNYGSQ